MECGGLPALRECDRSGSCRRGGDGSFCSDTRERAGDEPEVGESKMREEERTGGGNEKENNDETSMAETTTTNPF
eukprot:107967-Hanusia_phi.AAC.1